MSLVSNAAEDELDSPFYIANKELCESWDHYISDKGGQLKGKYNSWSYLLKAKVATNHIWEIEVKKSTYSNGSLFFSSKKQNLLERLTLKVFIKDSHCDDFKIRKPRYSNRAGKNKIYETLTDVLKPAMKDQSLNEAEFKDSHLTLVFDHKNDWFEMINKILDLDFYNLNY